MSPDIQQTFQEQAEQVWKFDLQMNDRTLLAMPVGASILHVARQNPHYGGHSVQLWARCNPDATMMEERRFIVTGTGHDIPHGAQHIGTILDRDYRRDGNAGFVWHVFEVDPIV